MILDEQARKFVGWRIDILATDIARNVLDVAQEGVYSQFEVQRGLPISMLLRYFQQKGDRWQIVEHIRSRVKFAERNLISDFSELGPFDLIFCRNVLIYFDVVTKRAVLDRLGANRLTEDGYLGPRRSRNGRWTQIGCPAASIWASFAAAATARPNESRSSSWRALKAFSSKADAGSSI